MHSRLAWCCLRSLQSHHSSLGTEATTLRLLWPTNPCHRVNLPLPHPQLPLPLPLRPVLNHRRRSWPQCSAHSSSSLVGTLTPSSSETIPCLCARSWVKGYPRSLKRYVASFFFFCYVFHLTWLTTYNNQPAHCYLLFYSLFACHFKLFSTSFPPPLSPPILSLRFVFFLVFLVFYFFFSFFFCRNVTY